MHKETTETVRFRLWVSDETCYEGEATVSTYKGDATRDEFGFEEGDSVSADIARCYRCEEGKPAVEVYPYTHGFELRLQYELENAAIEATWGTIGLPIVFPGEQQETEIAKAA